MATYLGSGDVTRHRTDYTPEWLGKLADDVTMEASVMNGIAKGPAAVRAILSFARTLYDYQEFNVIGRYGERDFVEDYVATFRAEPIGSVVVVRFNEAGETQQIVINHRPLKSVLLWSKAMAERFAGTGYGRYFLQPGELAGVAGEGRPMSGRSGLQFEVFVSEMAPAAGRPLPDGTPPRWSPLSHTLIFGHREALLTDPPITRAQADALADWVHRHDVALRYIYLTHGHADHWLTTNYLLRGFPDATVVTTQAILSRIAAETPGGTVPVLWTSLFGDAVPPAPVIPNGAPFPADGLRIDGHELFAHEVGHSDTDDTSILHAPSIGLVVAGDVVYNNVHQYVAEGSGGGIAAWQRALDTVACLSPRSVVAGHKDPRRPDLASDIDQTRRYLDTATVITEKSADRAGFYASMKAQYPDRVNPWSIWLSALRLFPS